MEDLGKGKEEGEGSRSVGSRVMMTCVNGIIVLFQNIVHCKFVPQSLSFNDSPFPLKVTRLYGYQDEQAQNSGRH